MTTTAPMLTSEVSVNIESFQSEPTRARMSAARGSRRKKLASCRADGGHRACPAKPQREKHKNTEEGQVATTDDPATHSRRFPLESNVLQLLHVRRRNAVAALGFSPREAF